MPFFGFNLALALIWFAVLGKVGVGGLALGFLLGAAALWLTRPLHGETRYFQRLGGWFGLGLWLAGALAAGALAAARDALLPAAALSPGVVAVPLAACTPRETLLVALLASLTPGTLTLDIQSAQAHPVLQIHALRATDPESLRSRVRTLERRLLELLR